MVTQYSKQETYGRLYFPMRGRVCVRDGRQVVGCGVLGGPSAGTRRVRSGQKGRALAVPRIAGWYGEGRSLV